MCIHNQSGGRLRPAVRPVRMIGGGAHFTLRLARDARDLAAAQRLRYRVFVQELGADGPGVDHDARLERDAFDDRFEHLLLIDTRRDASVLDDVVGVYRIMTDVRAGDGRFYSEDEYDLSTLRASGRRLMELGRSCVDPDYRRGTALLHLWNGLAEQVTCRGIEIMFGAASFQGTDIGSLAQPLANLHHHHLAPEALRVRAVGPGAVGMDILPQSALDRKAAMLGTPALIKAYLRLGGFVGDGAWIDRAFKTTDVCLVMDTDRMSARHREFLSRKQAGG